MNVRRSRALYGGSPPPRQWSMDCPGGGLSCSGPCRPPPERAPPLSRFIPACAGNTRQMGARMWPGSVHPRVCGEHFVAAAGRGFAVGSSPRVRGTQPPRGRVDARYRFIPACAGNTAQSRFERREHRGSSPRVRGTRSADPEDCPDTRFIPACAGNTLSRSLENARRVGSSPRVRGTRLRAGAAPVCGRFIPACAGNTAASASACPPPPVHPRVCGEHAKSRYRSRLPTGSSPRVRGTRTPGWIRPRPTRFIPACAGNTNSRWQ